MYVDMPLSSAGCVLAMVIFYLCNIMSKLTQNMVDKEDPFSNIYLVALIILFVDAQVIVFKVIDIIFMSEKANSADPILRDPKNLYLEIVITRYATMSMELLFVIIPLRHNFMLHQVEI